MDRRGSWSLALSNGTEVVVGRADARPRLSRFARMLPQLLARNASPLERADLRYTNGFALSWSIKKPAVPGAPSSAPAAIGGTSQTQAST
jgi:cell division protein FtsQ